MRFKPETLLILALAGFAAAGIAGMFMLDGDADAPTPGLQLLTPPPVDAATWLSEARPYCTANEVDARLRSHPAPSTLNGSMHRAACLALAGRIQDAHAVIEKLPRGKRGPAADVVFAVGHPIADRGDELGAGPLMELVVEYRPDHYMALYHAGSAAWQRGDLYAARMYLTRFLEVYAVSDGWRSNATSMLEAIEG